MLVASRFSRYIYITSRRAIGGFFYRAFSSSLDIKRNGHDRVPENSVQKIDLQGIQLQFLVNWTKEKNIPSAWTTADVVSNIILPETNPFSCSYCDYLKMVEKKSAFVGPVSIFVSYAWSCRFTPPNRQKKQQK